MKLIRCHIENFGKLQMMDVEFIDGLNVFFQENGWGKSTLTAFLRVMLYGFDGETKRKQLENERRRYQPWQGGVYGGSLVYEVDGTQYELTRIFGEKRMNDKIELREVKTNRVLELPEQEPGEMLFGMNSESFKRTVFLEQNDFGTYVTDGIHAKMTSLADLPDIGSEGNGYQAASEAITQVLNELTPHRKTGKIYKLREMAAVLKRQISNGATIENSLAEYDELLKEQEELLVQRQEQVNQLSKRQQDMTREQEPYEEKKTSEIPAKPPVAKKGPGIALLVIGIILLAAGAAAYLLGEPYLGSMSHMVGIIGAVIGLVLLILGIISYANASKKAREASMIAYQEKLERLNRMGEKMDNFMRSQHHLQQQKDALEEDVKAINGRIMAYKQQIAALQEQHDERTQLQEESRQLQIELDDQIRRYELLQKTQELMGRAHDAMTSQYTGPLLKGFGKYYETVSEEDAGGYHLDANMNLTRDELGLQRELGYLSEGYQNLAGICLRLSLVDSMYTEEKPFLILDDPFVNLDEKKLEGGIRLLEKLAEEYQVLYFTCQAIRTQ